MNNYRATHQLGILHVVANSGITLGLSEDKLSLHVMEEGSECESNSLLTAGTGVIMDFCLADDRTLLVHQMHHGIPYLDVNTVDWSTGKITSMYSVPADLYNVKDGTLVTFYEGELSIFPMDRSLPGMFKLKVMSGATGLFCDDKLNMVLHTHNLVTVIVAVGNEYCITEAVKTGDTTNNIKAVSLASDGSALGVLMLDNVLTEYNICKLGRLSVRDTLQVPETVTEINMVDRYTLVVSKRDGSETTYTKDKVSWEPVI